MITGTVHRYGDNIDTDVIIPARYLNAPSPEELAKHCMEDIDASFVSTVRPGDIVMGDIDGVICIPREIAYEVLLRAEGIERNEVDIFSWVHQGDTISEIIDKGGYF